MGDVLRLFRKDKPYVRADGDLMSLYFAADAVQSQMSCLNPSELLVPYTKTMMGFLLTNPNPYHILMIGLGGGSMLKFCYEHLPKTKLTVIEINPEVIALRHLFKIPVDDERLTVVQSDGSVYLSKCTEKFDVILVDGFNGQGLAEQLVSQSFYEDCYRSLFPYGTLMVNLDPEDPGHFLYTHRIQKAFNYSCVDLEVPDRSNRVLFAGRDFQISSRSMSLSWTLGAKSEALRAQLTREFQSILHQLDRQAMIAFEANSVGGQADSKQLEIFG